MGDHRKTGNRVYTGKSRVPGRATPERLATFLAELGHNGGNVKEAAAVADLSLDTLYAKRDKDGAFRLAWAEAKERGIDRLEDEAVRRALHGEDEPLSYKGELTGDKITRKSDRLLMFLLAGNRAKYKASAGALVETKDENGNTVQVIYYMPDNGRIMAAS